MIFSLSFTKFICLMVGAVSVLAGAIYLLFDRDQKAATRYRQGAVLPGGAITPSGANGDTSRPTATRRLRSLSGADKRSAPPG